MRTFIVFALGAALALALAAPAFATGADGAGRAFGQHVATHAQAGHFDGAMNPGRMHRGFSGWPGHHDM